MPDGSFFLSLGVACELACHLFGLSLLHLPLCWVTWGPLHQGSCIEQPRSPEHCWDFAVRPLHLLVCTTAISPFLPGTGSSSPTPSHAPLFPAFLPPISSHFFGLQSHESLPCLHKQWPPLVRLRPWPVEGCSRAMFGWPPEWHRDPRHASWLRLALASCSSQ